MQSSFCYLDFSQIHADARTLRFVQPVHDLPQHFLVQHKHGLVAAAVSAFRKCLFERLHHCIQRCLDVCSGLLIAQHRQELPVRGYDCACGKPGDLNRRYLRYAVELNADKVKALCKQAVLQQGVELANKPVNTLDNEIYSAFQYHHNAVPNALEYLFDAFPRLCPVAGKHAGNKVDQPSEDVIFEVLTEFLQIACKTEDSHHNRGNTGDDKRYHTPGQEKEPKPGSYNSGNQKQSVF